MASSKAYLDFVLEQLAGLEAISYRPMMSEYVLYCGGKVVGGVYDDRLLLKPAKSAQRLMREEGLEITMELPYEGAKEMLVADVDRRELLCRIVRGIADDLPAPKKRKDAAPHYNERKWFNESSRYRSARFCRRARDGGA